MSPFRLFGRPADDAEPEEYAAWYGAAADPSLDHGAPAYRPPHSRATAEPPPVAAQGWGARHPLPNGWAPAGGDRASTNGRELPAAAADDATAATRRKDRRRGARRSANGHGETDGTDLSAMPWGAAPVAGPFPTGAASPRRAVATASPTGGPWPPTATPTGRWQSTPPGGGPWQATPTATPTGGGPWPPTARPGTGTARATTPPNADGAPRPGTAPPSGPDGPWRDPAAPTTPDRRGSASTSERSATGFWGGPLTTGDPRVDGDPPTDPRGFPPVPAFSPAMPDPTEAAALAGAFAVDYLSWDEDDPERRGRVLLDYLPSPGRDPARLGWSGKGRQRAELALPGVVRPDGDGRVLVDVRVRVTPYVAVGGHAISRGADDPDVAGAPAAAPAPTGRGWRSLASTWIRLSVPVTFDGGRMVIDAWDETLGEEPPPAPRPTPGPDDHTLVDDDPLQEPVPGGVW